MSVELELNWDVLVRTIWVLPTSIVLRLGSKSEETSESQIPFTKCPFKN